MGALAPSSRHEDMAQPTTEGKSIIAVGYRECRFPIGEKQGVTMFCAHRTASTANYCPTHQDRMYAPKKPASPKPFILPK